MRSKACTEVAQSLDGSLTVNTAELVQGVGGRVDRLVQSVLLEVRRGEYGAANRLAAAIAVRLHRRVGEALCLWCFAEVAVDQGGLGLQVVVVQEADP